MRPCSTLLLAAGLFLPVANVKAENPATDQERAAAMVAQLRSDDFQVRQAAAATLERLGAAALPALRAARKDLDPEVRRRVAELLPLLECRLETARQLEAPRLRVHYHKTPLADVLADLSQRSGNTLKLGPGTEVAAKRLVTLDGEWTFWEALSHVCTAAGVAEPEPDVVAPPATPQVEEGGFRGARGARRFLYMSSLRSERSAPDRQTITLTDGQPASRSTFQAGALRIRMLGPRASCPADAGGNHRFVPLTLEVKPEPRIGWERLAAVRIDRVVDDQGQELPAPPIVLGDRTLQNLGEDVVIIWDGQGEFPLPTAPQLFAFSFPVNEQTGGSLREIRGSVAGWIRTAPEALISIDHLPKAVNETLSGPSGCRLRVVQCQREEDELYKLKIEVTPPENTYVTDFLNRHIVRANRRRFIEQTSTVLDATTTPFVVTGDQGDKLGFVNGTCDYDSNGSSRVYTLIYKPDKSDKGPATLVYRDRRIVFVEVPFTLKDVPLYNRAAKR
jgi:hypothetical protein